MKIIRHTVEYCPNDPASLAHAEASATKLEAAGFTEIDEGVEVCAHFRRIFEKTDE